MGALLAKLRRLPPKRVLMLGIDAAGKTALLGRLTTGETLSTVPTIGFNVETVKVGALTLNVWDVGGQNKIRKLWHHYYQGSDALVFLADSADRERFEEAAAELHSILAAPELADIPVLVFANKQDLRHAVAPQELARALRVDRLRQNVRVFGSSVVTSDGIFEGMSWLADELKQRKRRVM